MANLIGSAVGLVAPFLAEKTGYGKSNFTPTDFQHSGLYDPNRFNYGGQAGGADAAANRYRAQAEGAQQRQGVNVNEYQTNADRSTGLGARGDAQQMADMMRQRAMGKAPLISQMQADRQMQQAAAAQASQAASARGAAGLALAQQNAANNVATMQGAISNQAQINAAQEQQANEQGAMGAYMGLRGTDLQQQAQDAQQAQYQAQLLAAQRAQNDQYDIAKSGMEMGVRNAQLQADQYQQGIMANSHAQGQQLQAGVDQANANRDYDYLKMGMGAAQGGADSFAQNGLSASGEMPPPPAPGGGTGGGTPGKRAAGGPVSAGHPYLVGEQGPELIVPTGHGVVIPAGQTAGLLGGVSPEASLRTLGAIRSYQRGGLY